MDSGLLVPARIDFSDPSAPRATDFDDLYHTRAGALGQARHVFLAGNGLPGRWSGQGRFVVLETGFGLGNNFLATWAAWRDDPHRCQQLCFVSMDKHPLQRDDMARAHGASALAGLAAELLAAWPPLVPGMHAIDFDEGRVRLMLAFGDVAEVLATLDVRADAIYLDGFAHARNPAMWSASTLEAIARLAAPGCTLATWSTALAMREALASHGFAMRKARGYAFKRKMTVGEFRDGDDSGGKVFSPSR